MTRILEKRKIMHELQLKNINFWRMHLKGSTLYENTIIEKLMLTIFPRYGKKEKIRHGEDWRAAVRTFAEPTLNAAREEYCDYIIILWPLKTFNHLRLLHVQCRLPLIANTLARYPFVFFIKPLFDMI